MMGEGEKRRREGKKEGGREKGGGGEERSREKAVRGASEVGRGNEKTDLAGLEKIRSQGESNKHRIF